MIPLPGVVSVPDRNETREPMSETTELAAVMTGHRVAFELDGDSVWAKAWCDNEAGASCREKCVSECDAWGDGVGCDHERTDGGYCNVVEWLNAESVIECYDGDSHAPVDGPIEVEWNGDCYVWFYPAEVAAAVLECRRDQQARDAEKPTDYLRGFQDALEQMRGWTERHPHRAALAGEVNPE